MPRMQSVVLFLLFGTVVSLSPLAGTVDDCCCEVSNVTGVNIEFIYPLLSHLVERTFFKYFKVNLNTECPFWVSESSCSVGGGCNLDCCDENEVPKPWLLEQTRDVDRSVDSDLKKWVDDAEDIWVAPEKHPEDMSYINLAQNPEVNTGYSGPEAVRVWMTIYKENCFQGGKFANMCFEERVFYRLVSGMHSSITASIFQNFYKETDSAGNVSWKPNLALYKKALGDWPDRLMNIHFTYLFLLRAVTKSSPFLLSYDYKSGRPEDDKLVHGLLSELVTLSGKDGCSAPFQGFQESEMFQGEGKQALKNEFRSHFRNISRIVDCVACESCRMHVKLKTLGIGTALKILFAPDANKIELERNEIIALINTLKEFSHALVVVDSMEKLEKRQQFIYECSIAAGAVVTFIVFYLLVRRLCFSNKTKTEKAKKN